MIRREGMPYIYELFIMKAHNYADRKSKNGADAGFFNSLIIYEEKPHLCGSIGKSFVEYRTEIKGYIAKAMNKLFEGKELGNEKETLDLIRKSLLDAETVDSIFSVIQDALELDRRLAVKTS